MASPTRNPSSSIPCFSDVPETGVRRRDSRFVSQADLERWIRDRRAMVEGSILTIVSSGARYVLRDCVRILAPRESAIDVFGMSGRVLSISELFALSATVNSWSVTVGAAQYDAQYGYVAQALDLMDPQVAQA